MSDIKQFRTEAEAFAKQHLSECSAELMEWQDTAILRDGKVRELALMCNRFTDGHSSLRVAESFVNRAAHEFVIAAEGVSDA